MSEVDYLYETPETGQLTINDQGKAERVFNSGGPGSYEGPSLSGSEPSFPGISRRSPEQKYPGGLGGSVVPRGPMTIHEKAEAARAAGSENDGVQVYNRAGWKMGHDGNYSPPRALTPEELMVMANQMESDLLSQHEGRMSQGPAVHVQDSKPDAPDWLNQYMESQSNAGESQFGPIDRVGAKKYRSEQDMLRQMKAERR